MFLNMTFLIFHFTVFFKTGLLYFTCVALNFAHFIISMHFKFFFTADPQSRLCFNSLLVSNYF
jgi:hypothetical protein